MRAARQEPEPKRRSVGVTFLCLLLGLRDPLIESAQPTPFVAAAHGGASGMLQALRQKQKLLDVGGR